jgi:hypothetical protein
VTERSGIVTLLTDFGLADTYAGVMKGVLLSQAPSLRVVDLTHSVSPQAVEQGAFLLEGAWRYFPPGTVHIAVVDPGVGSGRRRLALSTLGHFFVGPDNGLLSAAIPEWSRPVRQPGAPYVARAVTPDPDLTAVSIESRGWSPFISATFEGRDVFAPAAARLAAGGRLEELGPAAGELLALPAFRAPLLGDELDGLVVHVDAFGNLITDIRGSDLPPRASVLAGGQRLSVVRTYAEASGLAAIVGSSGFLEVALPGGSAAAALGAGRGARVTVVP